MNNTNPETFKALAQVIAGVENALKQSTTYNKSDALKPPLTQPRESWRDNQLGWGDAPWGSLPGS